MDRVVLGTNENDVLESFFKTGVYAKPPTLKATIAPAIDIQVPYNLERLLYYAAQEDSALLRRWMEAFESTTRVEIPQKNMSILHQILVARSTTEQKAISAIKRSFQYHRYIIDPHTAVGVSSVEEYYGKEVFSWRVQSVTDAPLVCVSTAHYGKFSETIGQCLGNIPMPDSITHLRKQPDCCVVIKKADAPTLLNRVRQDIAAAFSSSSS